MLGPQTQHKGTVWVLTYLLTYFSYPAHCVSVLSPKAACAPATGVMDIVISPGAASAKAFPLPPTPPPRVSCSACAPCSYASTSPACRGLEAEEEASSLGAERVGAGGVGAGGARGGEGRRCWHPSQDGELL